MGTEEVKKNKVKQNNWRKEIIPVLPDIFKQRGEQGRGKLSLRGLYYLLWKAGIIKKSQAEIEAELAAAEGGASPKKKDNLYDTLSGQCADARLDPDYNPRYAIPLDALRDDSKPISEDPPSRTAAEEAELTKRYISRDTWRNYYTRSKWYGQSHYVEVWFEKATIYDDVDQMVNDELQWQIKISANGGNKGVTNLHDAYIRLWKQQYIYGKKVHVIYLGDYDAYGWDMDRDIRKRLYEIKLRYMITKETVTVELPDGTIEEVVPLLDLHNGERDAIYEKPIEDGWDILREFRSWSKLTEEYDTSHVFQRLAITKTQVKELGLTKIDARRITDEDMKLGSKWSKNYPAEYHFASMNDGQLFHVEIDDMVANQWDALKELLDDKISSIYDEDKAEEVENEVSEERFDQEMEKMLDKFCKEWMRNRRKGKKQNNDA